MPLVAIILLLCAVWVRHAKFQKAFLFEIHNLLVVAEHELQCIVEPSYTDVESFEMHCSKLVYSLVELGTTMTNACIISDEFPFPNKLQGIAPVTEAIRVNIWKAQPEDVSCEGFVSEKEKKFLSELLNDIAMLKDACDVDRLVRTPAALNRFEETYELFGEKWQHDAFRTPTGTSPFDLLNP